MSDANAGEGNGLVAPGGAVSGVVLLFYCDSCGRLISPATGQAAAPDAKHLCAQCVPANVPARNALRTSKATLVPAQRSLARSSSTRLRADTTHASSLRPSAATSAGSGSTRMLLSIGAGVAVLIVILIAILASDSPSEPRTPPPAPKVAEQTPTTVSTPTTPTPTPREPDPAPPPTEPSVTAPVNPEPPVPPANPVTPVTPVPAASPVAPATVAATPVAPPVVLTPGLSEKTFEEALAKALAQGEEYHFGSARAALRSARAQFSSATWWVERRGEEKCEEAEQALRKHIKVYQEEADDAAKVADKASTPEQLNTIEALWLPRANASAAVGAESRASPWVLLEAHRVTSVNGTTFTNKEDGSVLAGGPNPQKDVFTVTTQTTARGITAIRLEAMTDPSSPWNGPGRANNGNFGLSKITLLATAAEGAQTPAEVRFSGANTDNPSGSEGEKATGYALDDDVESHWSVNGRWGKPVTGVFNLAEPLGFAGGTSLTFRLSFETHWDNHTLGRFRLSYTTVSPSPRADGAQGLLPPEKERVPDEAAAGPAREVLNAVAEARKRLAEVTRQKLSESAAQALTEAERLLRTRPRQTEPIFKLLEEAEAAFVTAPAVEEELGERAAGLRFDAQILRDGELSYVYPATAKPTSSGGTGMSEVFFDFATKEQYAAWTPDLPNNSGAAGYDAASSTARLRIMGGHYWEGRDRRDAPMLTLPFYLAGESWQFEVQTSLIEHANKGERPEFGLLVSDGATSTVRLTLKEVSAKDMSLQLNAGNAARDRFGSSPRSFQGRPNETWLLRLTCVRGQVTGVAMSAGRQAVVVLSQPLGFMPRSAAFFLSTKDGGENAMATFTQARLIGVPSRERLKEVLERERPGCLIRTREEYRLAAVLKPIAARYNGTLRCTDRWVFTDGKPDPWQVGNADVVPGGEGLNLNCRFDVMLILPPWPAREVTAGSVFEIRFSARGGSEAQFFWTDTGFREEDSVRQPVKTDGEMRTVCFVFPNKAMVKQIRVDPIQSEGTLRIEQMAFYALQANEGASEGEKKP